MTKTDKTGFVFAKKKMNLLPEKQMFLNVPTQTDKHRKKEMCVTTKYRRLLEICIVQHVELKSVFTFQPTRTPVYSTVKGAKPDLTCQIITLRTKNRQICCFMVMVHNPLQEKRVLTTKKRNHLYFFKKFHRQSKSSTPESASEKEKNRSIYDIIVSTPYWLIQSTKNSFAFSFYIFSVYSRAT